MDFRPLFHRLKGRTMEKREEDTELPAPIAEGPPPEPVIRPPAPAMIPRWRLERESERPSIPERPLSAPTAPEGPALEVTLLLDDVMPRVPTHALKEGLHDLEQPLKLRPRDLEPGLASGRPTIALSQLAQRFPDIFETPANPAEDTEVVLPLQKILRQLEQNRLAAAVAAAVPVPSVFPAAIPPPAILRRDEPEEPAVAESRAAPVDHRIPPDEVATSQGDASPAPGEPVAPGESTAPTLEVASSAADSAESEAPAAASPASETLPPEPEPVAAPPPEPAATGTEPSAADLHSEISITIPGQFRIQPGPPRLRPPALHSPEGPLAATEAFAPAPAEVPPAGAIPESEEPSAALAPPEPALIAPPAAETELSPAEPAPESIAPVPVQDSSLVKPPEFFLLDQEPLRAIFMTDDELDLPRITDLAATLPGVSGCMILAGDHLTQGGERPNGLDASTLRELSRKLSDTLAEFQDKLPAESNFTLYGGNRALSIFTRPDLCLCVVHGSRGFLPGVRERLAAVADSLAEGLCSRREEPENPPEPLP